jgi:hypothetical protein
VSLILESIVLYFILVFNTYQGRLGIETASDLLYIGVIVTLLSAIQLISVVKFNEGYDIFIESENDGNLIKVLFNSKLE